MGLGLTDRLQQDPSNGSKKARGALQQVPSNGSKKARGANGSRVVPPDLWNRVETVFRQTKICVETVFRQTKICGILIGDLINFARTTCPATSGRQRASPCPLRRIPPAARSRKPAPPAAPAKLSPTPVPEDMDTTVPSPADFPGPSASISPLPDSETYSIRSNSC